MFLGGRGMDVKVTKIVCGLDMGWVFLPLAGLSLSPPNPLAHHLSHPLQAITTMT
jgi:hypothetical protein